MTKHDQTLFGNQTCWCGIKWPNSVKHVWSNSDWIPEASGIYGSGVPIIDYNPSLMENLKWRVNRLWKMFNQLSRKKGFWQIKILKLVCCYFNGLTQLIHWWPFSDTFRIFLLCSCFVVCLSLLSCSYVFVTFLSLSIVVFVWFFEMHLEESARSEKLNFVPRVLS